MRGPADSAAAVRKVDASAFRIPCEAPESDGTLEWEATTLVLVRIAAGGVEGLGFTYGSPAVATFVREELAAVVEGADALAIPDLWRRMAVAVRNQGRSGIASMAIAAVDVALWDAKARLLGVPLVRLLGECREATPIYGSGGFTSYSIAELEEQLGGWVAQGIPRVKMKVGRRPEDDVERVRAARRAIGPEVALYVDANGAYARQQALALAGAFADAGVSWFEEPVSSRDRAGLRWLRGRVPEGVEIAAGEYGYGLADFRDWLAGGCVDVLQADVTRCEGITGFLAVAALARASEVPLSSHCAPSLHAHLGCCVSNLRHGEYFHDHAQIEAMLFEGAPVPERGALSPDRSRPGLGLELRGTEASRYAL